MSAMPFPGVSPSSAKAVGPGRTSPLDSAADDSHEGFALLSGSDSLDTDDELGGRFDNGDGPGQQHRRRDGDAISATEPLVSRQPADLDQRFAAQAKAHNRAEHELTPWQAIQIYPTAIFWCLVASTCVIMEGYDTILIGNFFAYPTFAAKYGQFVDANGQNQLSAAWQAVLGNSSGIGCFFGVLINGYLVDAFGQKRVLLGALGSLSLTIFMTFFAPNIVVLMLGELLCGLPWGVFASSAPAYASEILPMCLRVYLTSYTNMCFIIGQLISAAVLAGLVHRTDEWAYRIPFALQWMWPALIAPLLVFAPESPWHLVRTGQLDKAQATLRRLQRRSAANAAGIDPVSALAHIVETNELEKRLAPGTSYWDCFRGNERRRTEIACVVFAGQVLAGSPFAYNSTYFFQQVGLSTEQTYLLNTGGTALAFAGTLVNWFALMPFYGRRRIFLCGMLSMSGILLTIGVFNVWASSSKAVGMIQAVLTLAWTFVFQLSVGQLGWAIPAEVGSTRLRQKTVCLARNAYYLSLISANAVQPYFINPQQLNLKGYTGFIWGGSAFLTFLWALFRLPETKDRTYEELDWLFAKKVATWKFASTRIPNPSVLNNGDWFASHYDRQSDEHDSVELDSMASRTPSLDEHRDKNASSL